MSEIFRYFFKLGVFGFGGPLAVISTIQKDLVEKEKWLSLEDFVKAFSLIKAMPGPIAFMTAVYVGIARGGRRGGLAAAVGLVLPSFLMMIFFTIFTSNFKDLNWFNSILRGMQICALAVILASLKGLIGTQGKKIEFWLLLPFGLLLNYLYPSWEPIIILGFGIFLAFLHKLKSKQAALMILITLFSSNLYAQENSGESFVNTLTKIAFVFLKAGSVVFGTGLAIIPMLEADVVQHNQWLSHDQFMSALVYGQITPGPVVITSTYIGYTVLKMPGAIVATIGIFLPAFIHIMTWFPSFVRILSRQKWIQHFVVGATSAVIGSIIVVVLRLGMSIEFDLIDLIVAFGILLVALMSLLPVWSLIPIGGIVIHLLHSF